MKFSKFIIEVAVDGEVGFKQLNTGAVIAVSAEDARALKGGEFDKLDQKTLDVMKEMGFVVEDDDEKTFLDLFQKEWIEDQSYMAIYILPTMNCQLECSYCFEDGVDRKKKMSKEVQSKTVEWLDSYLKENSVIKDLNVIFHGGEPLLHKEAIRWLLPRIQEICIRQGISLKTHIISNGVLLDVDFAQFLSEYNLQRIQLTLDGPAKAHDKRRPFKDGRGTYDRITANMRDVLRSGVIDKIHLRINIDTENISMIPEFLKAMDSDPDFSKKLSISLGIVSPTVGCDGCQSQAERYTLGVRLEESHAQQYVKLNELAKSLGYEMPTEYSVGPWCAARHSHSLGICPDGEIYKCASDFGRPDRTYGSIFGTFDTSPMSRYSENAMQKCLSDGCELVPICGGGCIFDTKADPNRKCQKSFLKEINTLLLEAQVKEA